MSAGSQGVYEALKKLFVTDKDGHIIVDSLPAITGSTDVTDRADRLLGIAYGNLAQLQQRATSFELLVQLVNAGVEINPQTIRALTTADEITAYGSQTQKLKQTATNYNLAVEEYVAGSAIDPRSIRALTAADIVTVGSITTFTGALETTQLLQPAALTAVTLYNVTMTNANAEYSQALPANTRAFAIHTQDGTAFRVAWVTGKVATPTAPYLTVAANSEYYGENLKLASATLYFACASSGKIVELEAWT